MRKAIVCMCLTGVLASGSVFAAAEAASATAKFEKQFAAHDGNHDGKMTQKEFLARWKNKKHGKHVFKLMDTNKDGAVSKDEYVAYSEKHQAKHASMKKTKAVKHTAAEPAKSTEDTK